MSNPTIRIAPDVVLGKNVRLFAFVNLYGCKIGDDSLVGTFVEIQSGVKIGSRVKIQSHSFICSGVEIGDEAFIGHGVMFTNDRFPRSTTKDGQLQGSADWVCEPTRVGKRASIGTNATILCGVSIGDEAVIGAGSVVVKDVPARAVVAGNPAKVLRILEPGLDK
jgi:UDP-2-acetamido-3-amino-2,3-dideoxy-glucuronate N-acetyltransferase